MILPFKNGGKYIADAVSSILSQSFSDIELILIDDRSTDGSQDYCSSLSDPRVRYQLNSGEGLVDALNTGLKISSGELIARMDADDVSLPDRIERQVEYLKKHINCSLLATNVVLIDEGGRNRGARGGPLPCGEGLFLGLSGQISMDPIVHPTIMMRRIVVEKLVGYRQFPYAEDREFWLRASRMFQFSRLEIPLLQYRVHRKSVSRTRVGDQLLSGTLAVANERVFRRSGVDMFADHPEAWLEVVAEANELRQSRSFHAFVRKSSLSTLKYEGRTLQFLYALLLSLIEFQDDMTAAKIGGFVSNATESIENSILKRL